LEDRAPDFEVSPLVIQEVEDQKQQDHQADARRPKSHGGQKRHDKNVGGSAVLHANRRAIPLAKGSSEEEAFSLYLESTAYRLIGQRR